MSHENCKKDFFFKYSCTMRINFMERICSRNFFHQEKKKYKRKAYWWKYLHFAMRWPSNLLIRPNTDWCVLDVCAPALVSSLCDTDMFLTMVLVMPNCPLFVLSRWHLIVELHKPFWLCVCVFFFTFLAFKTFCAFCKKRL